MPEQLSSKHQPDPARQHYPAALADLLALDKPTDAINYATYAAQLADCVPDLIRMVLDDDLNGRDADDPAVWAPLHALRVLASLAPAEAAEPLLECLPWDDEWFHNELPRVYGQIGPVAITLLASYLEDPAHDVFARGRASGALSAIAEAHPQVWAQVIELLTNFLDRPAADASADEEAVSTAVISDLADLKATTAYEAISRAYTQDRVNRQIIALEDVEQHFGLHPPLDFSEPRQPRKEPGVRLVLKCKACGREREHVFPKVYYDRNTAIDEKKRAKYDPLIIPQPVTCPKCGAVDQYELGGMGHIALMASLIAATQPGGDAFLREDQRIQPLTFTTRWGTMHPQEAIERYQQELARRPQDNSLHVGIANVYRFWGRDDQAVAAYQQALNLDPHTHEAWVGLAQLAVQRRNRAEAIRCWEQVRELSTRSDLPLDQQILFANAATESLDALHHGLFPPSEPLMVPAPPVARPQPARPAPPPQPKVGRNDPCPCGSGKKFKHCHGRQQAPM